MLVENPRWKIKEEERELREHDEYVEARLLEMVRECESLQEESERAEARLLAAEREHREVDRRKNRVFEDDSDTSLS